VQLISALVKDIKPQETLQKLQHSVAPVLSAMPKPNIIISTLSPVISAIPKPPKTKIETPDVVVASSTLQPVITPAIIPPVPTIPAIATTPASPVIKPHTPTNNMTSYLPFAGLAVLGVFLLL
jgi:hypothetical protein